VKAKWVPAVLTPMTASQAADAIRSAYETLEGVSPSVPTLALLMAQSALETWRWQSIYGGCFGNEKASASHEGFYQCYRCNEKLADGWHWYIPEGELVGKFGTPLKGAALPVPEGHPQTRFKAFQSLEAGAMEWLRLLKRRYPKAYAIAKGEGMPLSFVAALKAGRYFTADEAPYAKAVASLWREYRDLLGKVERDTIPVPLSDEDTCAALQCLAPDPERWVDAELRVLAVQAAETSWEALDEARRDERDRQMAIDQEDP
jgi:hypothetical protein